MLEAPGPAGLPLVGSLFEVRRDRLAFVHRLQREFGVVASFWLAGRRFLLVSGAAGIEHVLQTNASNYEKGLGLRQAKRFLGDGLLTSEGESWAKQRRLLKPLFGRLYEQRLGPIVLESVRQWCDLLEQHSRNGIPLDITCHAKRLALQILGRSLLDVDFHSTGGTLTDSFSTAVDHVMAQVSAVLMLPSFVPTPRAFRFRRALRMIDRVVLDLIAHGHDRQRSSFLSLLLQASTAAPSGLLSPRRIRDELVTFLFAGHETAANALVWTLILLAQNPRVWGRLRDEIVAIPDAQPLGAGQLYGLPFTRSVVEEAMRLFPPVWLIPRVAISDDSIERYHVPAGTDVLISPYVVHRAAEFWEDPDSFRPERFLCDSRPAPPFAYLPFGAGPRHCIGAAIAMTECQLILVTLTQRFRLELISDQKIQPTPMLSLGCKSPVWMKVVAA